MKVVLLTTFVFLSMSAPIASAQPFSALPHILKAGQEVIVRREGGRAIRGEVVFISDNAIVV